MNIEIYTEKAQYLTGEPVSVVIETNECAYPIQAVLRICCLHKQIRSILININEPVTVVDAGTYAFEFQGLGIDLYTADSRLLLAQTSVDIVKNALSSIRYGFLSDFEASERNQNEDIAQMRKLHINAVQFYDWSYRHDQLVADTVEYEDMMGKPISMATVQNKIENLKKYGMKAVAYGAVYAASEQFYKEHPDWAFYNSGGEVFRFIDIFYIMNIQADSPWRKHIINEYCKTISEAGFDGIHMDTYGFPKTAFSHLSGKPELVYLQDEFAGLIDDTRKAVSALIPEPCLIFNNVGNWPVAPAAKAQQNAVYIEVWNPYDTYFHLKRIIIDARSACDDLKPVILAAYLAPFRLEHSDAAGYSALYLIAAIVSNGGYQLLLGEHNGVLTQGYYVDYSLLTNEQSAQIRKYYDFLIRYMNIFYDTSLKDISMTHIGWDNYEYQCHFDNWSVSAEPEKVWLTIRENKQRKYISLINLCSCKDSLWNKGKPAPDIQKNLLFTVHINSDIERVVLISPDQQDIGVKNLDFIYLETDKGRFIQFTVPELYIWSCIYIDVLSSVF